MTQPPLPNFPDHPHDEKGMLLHDPTCWLCRQLTGQEPLNEQEGDDGDAPTDR